MVKGGAPKRGTKPEGRVKKPALRQCLACRVQKPKEQLLRVACYEGEIVVDVTGKAPGRGAYLCRTGDCLSQAIGKKLLAKAFHREFPQKVEQDLLACWQTSNRADLKAKILALLGLACRSRQLLQGATAVEMAFRSGGPRLLLLAEDLSEGSAEKFLQLARRADVPVFRFSTKAELGQRLGKEERAILAVSQEDFADSLLALLHCWEESKTSELVRSAEADQQAVVSGDKPESIDCQEKAEGEG